MSAVFIKEVSDYFQLLAAAHGEVKDSVINRAFCRYRDNEQFNQIRNNAAKNIVIIKSFFGKAVGEYDDFAVSNTLVISFSSYAKTVASKDIVAASELSFEIMLDFWVKMLHDDEEDNCLWLKTVDWQNIQFDEIEQPWLQNHYGWELIIPYKTTLPAFDISKWNGSLLLKTTTTLTFLLRFQVDAPGAPMEDGDEYLNDARFANKKLLLLVSGNALPCDDSSGDIDWTGTNIRHYEKTFAASQIKFVGAVVEKEIIEIYQVN